MTARRAKDDGGGEQRPAGGDPAGVRPPHLVEGPLTGQGGVAEAILRALPGWFGIESALLDYAAAAGRLPTFVVRSPGDAQSAPSGPVTAPAPDADVLGFLTLLPTSPQAAEVHVMAVRPEWHRRGIGRALVERAAAYARAGGLALLHVKTLAAGDPDPGYAATRRFYEALGFVPLQELPQVWGPENPCLILVRPL